MKENLNSYLGVSEFGKQHNHATLLSVCTIAQLQGNSLIRGLTLHRLKFWKKFK